MGMIDFLGRFGEERLKIIFDSTFGNKEKCYF